MCIVLDQCSSLICCLQDRLQVISREEIAFLPTIKYFISHLILLKLACNIVADRSLINRANIFFLNLQFLEIQSI